jgi:methyl halide transferase
MNLEEEFKDAHQFWNDAYKAANQGWDIGYASTPLVAYIDQLKDKTKKILIPGAGNAYEAEYLWAHGFKNLEVCDIAKVPLQNLQQRLIDFPSGQLLNSNFFDLDGQYDLILEQTFFCAIAPVLRPLYIEKMKALLKPTGKLVGVLFDDPNLFEQQPPYKGTKQDYIKLFEPYFKFHTFELCYNSIQPRAGREIFINLQHQ